MTGASTLGIDSCQAIPPVYINSLFGQYGTEIAVNGLPATANYVYGFYLGGLEAVHKPNPNCYIVNSATFINSTACQGWKFLPIWDGYQAPCSGNSVLISSNLATAANEGAGDAQSVQYDLAQIGLSGSVAYLDIEAYPTGNSSCSQAVKTYVSAWIAAMHSYGLYAGVYASPANIAQDMGTGAIPNVPDDIWVAAYSGGPQTSSLPPINNGWWIHTQRAHQYQGSTVLIAASNSGPNPHPAQNFSFDLDAVNSTVAVMINPPPDCDEGCNAACYNNTGQWCGNACMNCVSCPTGETLYCENNTPICDPPNCTNWCGEVCMNDLGSCPNGQPYQCNCDGSTCSPYCPTSPIVIDPFGEGFHLTDMANGVRFHVTSSSPPSRTSWTDPKWRNGWLALDRNGDGRIDDFSELFGNLTAQPPSDDPNGYLALAVFDDPANGGNGNGVIDPGDSVYDRLRLWIDANHNGISEPDELYTLQEVGIFRIGLKYALSSYVDPYGNVFRYKGMVWDKAGQQHDVCYDVFLQVGEADK